MTLEELRNAVCRYIDENREAYNETGDECYRAVKEELLHILGLIDSVDHEPVGNPDKMTLTEAAYELRKIFKFKYLTEEIAIYNPYFCLWTERPYWNGQYWGAKEDGKKHLVIDFLGFEIVASIDLSEYADESGAIDYSRCIVEVSGASE